MAHPYESSRAGKVSKSRVGSMLKGYNCGGMAAKKYASGGSVAPAKKAGGGEIKVAGRASGGRLDKYARGGKTKHKGTQVNIAVVQPHGGPPSPGGAPAGAGLPPPGGLPPKPPMAGGPPGMPPGGPMLPPGVAPGVGAPPPRPPGGIMPGRPPMKRGGAVKGVKGGDNGVGRKAKAKAYGLKPIKGKDE